jgi:hypothetical protein
MMEKKIAARRARFNLYLNRKQAPTTNFAAIPPGSTTERPCRKGPCGVPGLKFVGAAKKKAELFSSAF